jgi:hypothetical protein
MIQALMYGVDMKDPAALEWLPVMISIQYIICIAYLSLFFMIDMKYK